eukprot:763289-Hanusia_phi.AAC.1
MSVTSPRRITVTVTQADSGPVPATRSLRNVTRPGVECRWAGFSSRAAAGRPPDVTAPVTLSLPVASLRP